MKDPPEVAAGQGDRAGSGFLLPRSTAMPKVTAPDGTVKEMMPLTDGSKLLLAACRSGDTDTVVTLLDKTVVFDHTSDHPEDIMPMYVDRIVDEQGSSTLLLCIEHAPEPLACVKCLLQKKTPPGRVNALGRTPIMAACYRGLAECVTLLVQHGATPYHGAAPDANGHMRTPIALALDHFARSGTDGCARALLGVRDSDACIRPCTLPAVLPAPSIVPPRAPLLMTGADTRLRPRPGLSGKDAESAFKRRDEAAP